MRLPGFADLALGRKLTLLFTAASGMALLVFAVALWEYESDAYRRALLREMSTLSQTLADSSAAALAFRDDRSAAETLSVLRAETRVSSACLYRDPATLAAAYTTLAAAYTTNAGGSNCPAHPGPDRSRFSATTLTVVRTARLKGEVAGQLFLLVDLGDLYLQLRQLAFICAGVLGVSLLLAAIVASRLQRLISGPILGLAAVAGRVSAQRDYSIRAGGESKDELGVLVGRFNEMMGQVHERDRALECAQAELEDRVRDRTAELRNEIAARSVVERDLFAAKEAAEAANRAKSHFLANMSHELRTPLNAILLYGEMLQEDAEAADNQETLADLGNIVFAAKRLRSLINDVLDLSRIEAGKTELHSEELLVSDILNELVGIAEPLARQNNNKLVWRCDDRCVEMLADRMKLQQILINLIGNACKFTENGVVTVETALSAEQGSHWIQWRVQDTGIGISVESREKLFRPFTQIDDANTRKYGGTGLGLAISQQLCQLMGGRIDLASRPGAGSTFTVHLPLGMEFPKDECPKELSAP